MGRQEDHLTPEETVRLIMATRSHDKAPYLLSILYNRPLHLNAIMRIFRERFNDTASKSTVLKALNILRREQGVLDANWVVLDLEEVRHAEDNPGKDNPRKGNPDGKCAVLQYQMKEDFESLIGKSGILETAGFPPRGGDAAPS